MSNKNCFSKRLEIILRCLNKKIDKLEKQLFGSKKLLPEFYTHFYLLLQNKFYLESLSNTSKSKIDIRLFKLPFENFFEIQIYQEESLDKICAYLRKLYKIKLLRTIDE